MNIYVQAANQISIQQPLCESWLTEPVEHREPFVRAIDPDFRDYVSPVEGRRMGKLMKRALATSLKTLRECEIDQPDAIVTGTGLGSVESTEAFLLDLCQNGEQLLKPTHFMQSTHNTIGSLVAIQTKTHGYNATYSHGTISFESALADAYLQLRVGDIGNALVLGQDVTTERYFHLLELIDYVGNGMDGACGEASVAAMLMADASDEKTLCELAGVKLLHRPTTDDWQRALEQLGVLSDGALADDIVVMSGENGHPKNDELYGQWLSRFAPKNRVVSYKRWFGECFSASALGFYAAAHWIHADRARYVILLNIGREGSSAITLLKR